MQISPKILDPKLKRRFNSYVFQCSLATLVLFLVLSLEGAHLSKAVIIAAIASTTFVLFVTPQSPTASPRHVLGGHAICLILGGSVAAFDGTGLGRSLVSDVPLLFDAEAALTVGVGIFLMATTNTEHAPAAGTALGMVAHTFSWGLVLFVATSITLLSLFHLLFRSRLRDLL